MTTLLTLGNLAMAQSTLRNVPSANLQPMPSRGRSLVMIDTSLDDYQILVEGVIPGHEVYLLEAKQCGITQITQILRDQTGIASLHILSHGRSGELQLGSSVLNLDNLSAHAAQLQVWRSALAENAEILLYGCEVAQGELGKAFVNTLSQLTGTSVAASENLTGHCALGGDWELAVNTGAIAASLALDASTLANYTATFNIRISTASNGTQGNGESHDPDFAADGRYVVFTSNASNLVSGDSNNAGDIFVKDLLTGTVTRISTATNGTQANNSSEQASISADGRYVVFHSDASNLVSGDINNQRDIFVKDTQTGAISRVSTATDGTQANALSQNSAISANGRYVAFQSHASNLVSGDTNGNPDIFVKDLQTGTITLVSTTADGTQGSSSSYNPRISDDGRYVVFASEANNLVSGDTNGRVDVFVKDLQTGAITRVSTAADGTQTNGDSWNSSISADGRYIAFSSSASNLIDGDTNNAGDVFVKDLQTGAITRVSTESDGSQFSSGSDDPDISADGRYVAFYSGGFIYIKDTQTGTLTSAPGGGSSLSADGRSVAYGSNNSNVVSGDTNNATDVFVFDPDAASSILPTRVSILSNRSQANGYSSASSISVNERFVVFTSEATNLVSGDTNNQPDIFVKDTATHTVTRVSIAADGTQANNRSGYLSSAVISGDGATVAFLSDATNLIAGWNDHNGRSDIYVKNLLTGAVTLVSAAADGSLGNHTSGYGAFSISPNGRYVAFNSYASNLVSGDTNNRMDVFVKDVQTGAITRVSTAADGTQGNDDSAYGSPTSISADGRYVAFNSNASNLVSGDTNYGSDVFVKDLQTGAISRVNTAANGTQTNVFSDSSGARFSANGRYVVFQSNANNLVSGDTNDAHDIFVKDLQTGAISRVNTTVDGTQAEYGKSSNDASISSDGRFVVFASDASNLVSGDTNVKRDVFVKDTQTGAIVCLSMGANRQPGNNEAIQATISSSGRYVTFTSFASNLISEDTNNTGDVYTVFLGDPNAAPRFTSNSTLSAIDEDTLSPTGAAIANLFANKLNIQHNLFSSLSGIAITGNPANQTTEGKWQYSTDSGTNWFDVGTVADNNTALALSTATQLRFVAVANYNGTAPSLTVRALDRRHTTFTIGGTRSTVNTAVNGGTTAIAAATNTISIRVNAVSDAPTLASVSSISLADTAGIDTFNPITGTLIGADIDTNPVLTYGIAVNSTVVNTQVGSYGTLSVNPTTGAYTYTPNAAAINALSAGSNLTDAFTFSISDGVASATQPFIVNVSGVNDVAVIGNPTVAAVTEDTSVDGSGNLTATGSIPIVDGDQNQSTFNTTVISAGGNLGSLVLAADGTYTYSVANSAVQYLGAGETKTETFTVEAIDGTTKEISFILNGTNDAAVIGSPSAAAVTEDADPTTLTVTGAIAISDADQGQSLFKTAVIKANGNLGDLVLAADGTYTYSVANSAVQYLVAGETKTENFTIESIDGTTQTISFTLNGANDAAVIGNPTVAAVTEDVSVDGSGNLTATGSISINDADQNQSTFNTTVTSADGNLGSLVLAANGSYTYSVANDAVQLSAGDTQVDSFTITAVDGTPKTVSFTLNGTNDAAVIGNPTVTAIAEDADPTTLTVTGAIAISDVDSSASFNPTVISTDGNLGSLVLATDGSYTYSVANSVVQYLGVGETKVDSFTITAVDGTPKTISFTINGVNDAAVIGNPTVAAVTEDVDPTTLTATGSISISEVDQNQAIFNTTVTSAVGNLGSLVLVANGTYTYSVANSAVQYLGSTETKVDSFTITSVDGTAKTISFTISGTNDAAVIDNPTVAAVTEDTSVDGSGNLTATGSISISEVDQNQAIFNTTVTSADGNLGSLVLTTNGSYTYTVANSAAQYLGLGETKVDSFTITSVDGTAKTISFTINGMNDAAAIGNPTLIAVTEDTNVDGSNNLTATGSISISEIDQNQAIFNTTVTSAVGNRGSLVLATDGSYTYTVANDAVQYLGVGDTRAESFTIASVDGTTKTISFTINGTYDATVIGTPTVEAVTEEDVSVNGSDNLTATGSIPIANVNPALVGFKTTITSVGNNLGSLVLAADGSYTYTVANSAVQYLTTGQTRTEIFTIEALDGAKQQINFTINGVNDAAVIGTPTLAALTEDETPTLLTATGAIAISDVDNSATFNTTVTNADGNLGGLVLAANGAYTYSVANSVVQYLGSTETKVDSFTITSADGTTKTISFTITGVNDAPVIGNPTVVTVTEDASVNGNGNLIASGSISISDVDQNQAIFNTTATPADGNLGSLVLAANGSYTYSVANSAVQYLGNTETKVDTFTLTSADGATKTISFTINGVKDAAVIGNPTVAAVTEDVSINVSGNLTAIGSISINDADQNQSTLNTTVTSANGNLGSLVLAENGAYTYTVANSAAQYLGSTKTKVDSFTITSADGTTKTIDFTINGVNDTPVIGSPTVAVVTEDANPTTLTATGAISISDADQNQAIFNTTVTSAGGNLGSLVLAANGSYTYSVANSAVQYLAASQTKVETFTIASADGTTKIISFTINGVGDVPVIGTPTVVMVTEEMNVNGSGDLTATGSISINDADQNQSSFNTTVTSASGNIGRLELAANGSYTYSVANSEVQYLGANQTKVNTFTLTSVDGTTKTISFTINGTNDAAVIGNPTVTTISEGNVDGSGNVTARGSIAISDTDQNQAIFNTTVTSATGNLGSLALAANGSYTYTATKRAVQYLAANQPKVETFTITSVDGTSKTISFTLNGVNDAAVIGDPTMSTVTEDRSVDSNRNLTATGSVSISDVDSSGTFNTTVTSANGNLGSLVLTASGNYTYTVSNNAVQYLGANQTRVDTFTLTSADGTSKSINFTINGVNDVPVITHPLFQDNRTTSSVTEDLLWFFDSNGNQVFTGSDPTTSGSLTISDADQNQSTFNTTVISDDNNWGRLVLAANGSYTYTVANSKVQSMREGEVRFDRFTVTSADGTTETIKFAINGRNDVPTSLNLSNNRVTENTSRFIPVGTFSTSEIDIGDIHTYRLVDFNDVFSKDNRYFGIVQNQLFFLENPDFDRQASYNIRVRVSDGTPGSSVGSEAGIFDELFTISLNDVDEAPTARAMQGRDWLVGANESFRVADFFSDPERKPLTYTATLTNGGDLPEWLQFDRYTGTLSGTPPAIFRLNLNITAKDPGGQTVTAPLVLTTSERVDATQARTGLSLGLSQLVTPFIERFEKSSAPMLGQLDSRVIPNYIRDLSASLTNGLSNYDGWRGLYEFGMLLENSLPGSKVTVNDSVVGKPEYTIELNRTDYLGRLALPQNLGLPLLGIKASGGLDAWLGGQIKLTVGFDPSMGGFYISTDPTKTFFETNLVTSLSKDFTAKMEAGLLQLDLTNDSANPTSVNSGFRVTMRDQDLSGSPDDGERLTLQEMIGRNFGWGQMFSTIRSSDPNLGLSAQASVKAQGLPSINFDLGVDWNNSFWVNEQVDGQHNGSVLPPTINFNNLQLDLGSFISDIVRPVVKQINVVLEPFRPIVDVLRMDIGLIHTLGLTSTFDLNRDGIVNVIEVTTKSNELSGGTAKLDSMIRWMKAVVALDELTKAVDEMDSSETILIGQDLLGLGGYSFGGMNTNANVGSLSMQNARKIRDVVENKTLIAKNPKVAKVLKRMEQVEAMSFPILSDPDAAMKLLLGQDVDLFRYDMPDLDEEYIVGAGYNFKDIVQAYIGGKVQINTDLSFAYDTFGLREWKKSNFSTSGLTNLIDGFYVEDKDGDELTLTATVGLGVEAGVSAGVKGVLSAGVTGSLEGGIRGTVGIDLIDVGEREGMSDRKIRPSEISSRLNRPFDLFRITGGEVEAFIEGALSVEGSIGIPRVFSVSRSKEVWKMDHSWPLFSVDADYLRRVVDKMTVDGTPPPIIIGRDIRRAIGRSSRKYIAGATVFLDANFNGVQDNNEPWAITSTEGAYDLEIPMDQFDLNGNDTIDLEEGQFVSMGGFDVFTGQRVMTPLVAPVGYSMITPVTTLVSAVIAQGAANGVTPEAAEAQVKQALGLPEDLNLTTFDPIAAMANGDANGAKVMSAHVTVQTLVDQISTMTADSAGLSVAEASRAVTAAIAQQLQSGTAPDFSDPTQVQSLLNSVVTTLEQQTPNANWQQVRDIAEDAASVMAEGVQRMQTTLENATDAETALKQVSAVQALLVTETAKDLKEAANGQKAIAEVVSENTGAAMDEAVSDANAMLNPVPINGDFANNILDGTDAPDLLQGMAGDDTLNGGGKSDRLLGGDGDDVLNGGEGSDYLRGDAGNDQLKGDAGDDQFFGGAGNDQLEGGTGNDQLLGGADNDRLIGDAGDDSLDGGEGDDYLDPGTGVDTVMGGAGGDQLNLDFSTATNDTTITHTTTTGGTVSTGTTFSEIERLRVFAGSGHDTIDAPATVGVGDSNDGNEIYGGAGHDLIISGAGDDRLDGQTGNDNIKAGASSDQLFGGNGNDQLFGEAGNDELDGGEGNDALVGVDGNNATPGLGERDTLYGGAGVDRFVLGSANWIAYDDRNPTTNGTGDYALITDFNPAEDKIQLQGPASNYRLGASPINGITGTAIFSDKAGAEPDELIAILQNTTNLDLNSAAFFLVIPKNDFNSDNSPDLLWRNTATGQTFVSLMADTQTTTSLPIGPGIRDPRWQIQATGDFNNDSHTDLAWRNTATGQNLLWLMNDTQATATIELAPVTDRTWQLSGSGDFNNDNTTDLLWYNHNTGEIVTWSLENAALKERTRFDSQQTDTQWQLQGSGDFDGNGTDDLLWIHTSQNQAAIWFMNGLSRTQPQAVISQTIQAGQSLGAIADYNQDGKADLTWYTPTGQSETWLMNGNTVTQTLGLRSPDTSSSW